MLYRAPPDYSINFGWHEKNDDSLSGPYATPQTQLRCFRRTVVVDSQRRLFLLIDFKDRRRVADLSETTSRAFPLGLFSSLLLVVGQQATFATNSRG